MSLAYYMSLGGVARLEDGGATQLRRTVNKNGPPGFLAFPAFQVNPSFDPQGSGDDLFEYWANWTDFSGPTDSTTATFKGTANPIGGSGNFSYVWTLPTIGAWAMEPTQATSKDAYFGQVGTTSASNTASCVVTDDNTGEDFQFDLFLSVTRQGGGGGP